jgi:hypothetical protein
MGRFRGLPRGPTTPTRYVARLYALPERASAAVTSRVRSRVREVTRICNRRLCSGAFSSQSLNMHGPTVEDIIEKAKQLCRLDGMLWSNLDLQNPMAVQSRTTRMANVVDRRRYLKRAQTLLETQTR